MLTYRGKQMFFFIKKNLYLALFFALMFAFSTVAFAAEVKVFKLVAFDYPPFYYEKDNIVQGICVELANELFSRMDMEVEITMYPLTRALNNLETGKNDAIMVLIKTPAREKFLNYTSRLMSVKGFIWWTADRKENQIEFQGLEDLKPFKIGVTRGYSYGLEFDKLLNDMRVEVANSDLNNYYKLLNHRIDIFPGNELVAKGLFKNNKELQGKFVHSEKSFIKWDLYMAISKKSELSLHLNWINKIIDDLRNKGFINDIVKRYTE